MVATFVAQAKVVAGFDEGICLVCKANDTFVTITATFVDVVELGHDAVEFQFLQKNFPIILPGIFDRILSPFVADGADYSQNDSRSFDFAKTPERIGLLELYFFSGLKKFFKEKLAFDAPR